ncbi:hypothetical protein ABZS77_01085 [Micromonospora sp. NPDC005298]|uniref:hypothetical protein n=1 Tax=Micromonospora sp. NPDC005298 TaxID=3156873 RepID=UPI0033ACB183
MNLGPFARTTVRRPHALAGTAALLFLTFGAAACGASSDVAAAPAGSGTTAPAVGTSAAAETASAAAETASAGEASTGGAGGSLPDATPARPATSSVQWPQLTWYTAQESGQKQNDPARVWRRTAGGTWQLVREGRAGSGSGKIDGSLAVSPDGRRAARVEGSAGQLVISAFDGTAAHVIPTQGQQTCTPDWLDSGRVLYGVGRDRDWTIVAVNADGTGRKVLASHQATCPAVSNGWIAQVTSRAVSMRNEGGTTRSVTPRVPAGLVVGKVAAISGDGRTLVISTHTSSPGGCACTWQFRNYRVDVATGKATELAHLDRAWTKPTGHGQAVDAMILADGGLVVQVDAATPADSAPAYRLVRYAADGRVLASAKVPAGQPWGGLLG